MDRRQHWNTVFATKSEQDLSWFEALPDTSLRLLESSGLSQDTCVLDIGGGDSHLIDALTARGLDCLAVLDVSGEALARARSRLGSLASVPVWLEVDVAADWALKPMDIWHDRAVFHFLTTDLDRQRYRRHLLKTLKVGGWFIVATFALDGPERCSGLPVVRYSPERLAGEFGPDFTLVDSLSHTHMTPWGSPQRFTYCRFRRRV